MRRVTDVLLLVWVAAWIVMAVAVGRDIRNLTRLSDTVVGAGRAVQQTGQAVRALEGLPFVGAQLREIEGRVAASGAQAVRSGRESRGSIRSLSVLLALAVGLIPTVPLVAAYLPFRISWARDVRAVRRGMATAESDPAFDEFLARRAAENLSYHHLRQITVNPWRDLEQGRYQPLADAELRRLGLRRLRRP